MQISDINKERPLGFRNINWCLYDDHWRNLATTCKENTNRWLGHFGETPAYGHATEDWVRPLDLDVWGDPWTLQAHAPLPYEGTIDRVEIEGREQFTIRLQDLRPKDHPIRKTLAIPVGLKIPYAPDTVAFGIKEMYLEPEIIDQPINSPGFPREWFYLEAELFGQVAHHPMDGLGRAPDGQKGRIHCGAPMALFKSGASQAWSAVASESEYGAALQWNEDHLLFYTTLYLEPGEEAQWRLQLWDSATAQAENVYLEATRPGGVFDQLNPPAFERMGPPEGPIVFINVNRPDKHFEELRKIRPKLVILNYFYDHVSAVAGLKGEWTTYEGYAYSETKFKALIEKLRGMGAQVGFYGTQVEQPETHPPLEESDIVMDAWGRRFHAWEPGNWVVDAGNRNCAQRLAQAEAEFAQYYGFDCVFIDRQDHLSVNRNPARKGKQDNSRLRQIPSVRLGLIELNKERVRWQRKLNPHLRIGINNTTQWVGGVRYADFNLLEGGMDLEPPVFFLNAPFGLIHKQHYALFFADLPHADVVDHGIVQKLGGENAFTAKRRQLYKICLADGVAPQPYEDEIFVPAGSLFAKDWNSREMPDEAKWAIYKDLEYYGAEEWREDEIHIARAMQVARRTFPIALISGRDSAEAANPKAIKDIRFSARLGTSGAFYAGIFNQSKTAFDLNKTVLGCSLQATIPAGKAMAWFRENDQAALETCSI